MHVVESIALVNHRLGPRSLQHLANRPVTGDAAIIEIIIDSQILIAAHVVLAMITQVASQVLPVGPKISLIFLEIGLVGLNVGSVARDVALILHAVSISAAADVTRDLLVLCAADLRGGGTLGGGIAAVQALPVGSKISLVPLKILLISPNVSLVARDIALITCAIAILLARGRTGWVIVGVRLRYRRSENRSNSNCE